MKEKHELAKKYNYNESRQLDYGDKIAYTAEEELERAMWELNVAQQAYFKALNRAQQERYNPLDAEEDHE